MPIIPGAHCKTSHSIGYSAQSGTNAALRHLTLIARRKSMMSDLQKYRQHAEECRKMAEKAFSPLDKEVWLQLAADWLRMVQLAEQREGRRRDE
jgi:hypothetical protein